jgi:hypothetical protein
MAWGDEEPTEVLERVDPFPFTRDGRLYQRIEHELSLTEAVLRVGFLVLEKQRIRN